MQRDRVNLIPTANDSLTRTKKDVIMGTEKAAEKAMRLALETMESVHIASKHQVSKVLGPAMEWSSEGPSAVNNTSKFLVSLSDLGKLERLKNGIFRITGCRSEGKEHALAITDCAIDLMMTPHMVTLKREHAIQESSLRCDLLTCIERPDGLGVIAYIEVLRNESKEYCDQKFNTLFAWPEMRSYMANLFNLDSCPKVLFITSGKENYGYMTFKSFMEKVSQ